MSILGETWKTEERGKNPIAVLKRWLYYKKSA
jgi:hypothetical protein